jgi:Ca-activated chloride channel homolog
MTFQYPLAFLLLLIIPFAIIVRGRKKNKVQSGIPFPSVSFAEKAPKSVRQKLGFVKPMLIILSMIFIIIAIARPRYGMEEVRDINKGIAIEMVVDRSGSMGAEIIYEGRTLSRLDAAKTVFSSFVLGNGKELQGRSNDLIGMVTFARYADTVYPLSLSHITINSFLKNVTLVKDRNEDGTAIGDALTLAGARLKTVEKEMESQKKKEDYIIKSKIIILLTDGRNNWGDRTPVQAAELVKDWGIKIYAIGLGSVDSDSLRNAASITGGKYFAAKNVQGLMAVYSEIDKLEKSEIESVKYMDYQEAFLPFVFTAIVLISLYIILSATLLRRIP